MKRLDRFYPIVDSAGWVARIVGAGAKWIQLRAKDLDEDLARREIILARDICAKAGAQLIVNDYWRIAIEERCDFVHLGQGDLESADVNALRRAGIRLGLSTHNLEELERALSHSPDYVALGPIFPTLLKQMPWAPQGLNKIGEWRQRIGAMPLVAIGGLTIARAQDCIAAGADSAAVVTDILKAENPEARAKEWIDGLTTRMPRD